MTRFKKSKQQRPSAFEEEVMRASEPGSSMPWPEHPSPLRRRLSDYTRAHRLAQRLFERHGRPVAIIAQDCPIQAHCVLWGEDVFCLELEGKRDRPYRLVSTIF